MANEVAIPESFKSGPASAFKQVAAQTESLAEGIGSSYGVLYYKGKNWSLGHRGERHNFVRPDDGTPLTYMDVIILRGATHKSKSFYEGSYDPNGSSEGKRPTCSSLDGVMPDADIAHPQANACAVCPRNVWKVNAEGKKVRECSDYKRLAVLIVPNLTKAILGTPLLEPVFLRIPAASLDPLAKHGQAMEALGFPMHSYVTRIKFDPDQAHPKMIFSAVQQLTNDEAPVILKMRDDPETLRIIGADQIDGSPITQPQRLAPTAAPQLAPPQQQAAPVITVTPQVVQPQPVAQPQPAVVSPPIQTGLGLTPATATPSPVSNGGGLGIAPTQAPPPATGGVLNGAPVADVGQTTEADQALDARIAAAIK